MISMILYGIAIVLAVYVAISIYITKKFKVSDALILLGIVVSTITALGEPLPIPVPTVDPTRPILSDNFDDPAYNGIFNSSLWVCDTCAFGSLVSQDDSFIRLETTNGSGGLRTQSSWFSYQINSIQGKLKLQSTDASGGFVSLGFGTSSSLGSWQTICFIAGNKNATRQATFSCEVCTTVNGQYKCDYTAESKDVNYGDWHTAKIAIMPRTFELRFYFNNGLVGQYIPPNASELQSNLSRISLSVSADAHIVGYVDDVIIQPAR